MTSSTNPYPPPAELFSLRGEVAVVTGGGRGIGEGIARTLASAGAKVVVAARRGQEVEAVAAQIRADGGEAIGVATDVTDDAAVEALAQTAVKEFGRLSIWVNNAGGSPARLPMTELSRTDWDACISLNLTAVWIGIVTAAKHMQTGSIINVSSGAGSGPVPGSGHYGAAKAGVNSLTQTASAELAPRIRVNGIAPGAVPTEIFKRAMSSNPTTTWPPPKQSGTSPWDASARRSTWGRRFCSCARPQQVGSPAKCCVSVAVRNPDDRDTYDVLPLLPRRVPARGRRRRAR